MDRAELFIRLIWIPISFIVCFIMQAIAIVCSVLLWFVALITGKRNAFLTAWIKRFFIYRTNLTAYMLMLTDERSPLLPEM